MRQILKAATVLLALSPSWSFAQEAKSILGQEVVVKDVSDAEEELSISGKALHKNTYVSLGKSFEIGGTIGLTGTSSPGGNACAGAPFVLLIKPDGSHRFDGPIDTCYYIEPVKEGESVIFQTPRVAGSASQKWVWTPADGFKPQADIAFAPDAGTTWADLRAMKLEFVSDLFKNAEIFRDVQALLGKDYAAISEIFGGPGSGEWKGDNYVASICRAHACIEESLLLVLNPSQRTLHAAWKPSGKPIVVYPSPVKTWSNEARAELKEWAKIWE